jgi:hypothetical protein
VVCGRKVKACKTSRYIKDGRKKMDKRITLISGIGTGNPPRNAADKHDFAREASVRSH